MDLSCDWAGDDMEEERHDGTGGGGESETHRLSVTDEKGNSKMWYFIH